MTTLDLVILSLAAFRVTRLVGWDDLTRRPRARVAGLSDAEYDRTATFVDDYEAHGADAWERHAADLPPRRRFYLAKLIHCPWCVGFWVSLVVSAAYWAWPSVTVGASVPFAISAIVGLVAKNGDP